MILEYKASHSIFNVDLKKNETILHENSMFFERTNSATG